MALLHYLWSRVAASNATADSNVNWAEGQAPSSVNDSARAMMASAAGFRDDISGAIVTGGASTAYTVTSYQVFDTLAHMNGSLIAFTPHVTNGATVTLNVDGLGAKPLRPSPNVELQSNVLIVGTPYMVTYNNSDAVWYLHGNVGSAAFIPLGAGMDFWGSTAPSSAFAFPTGQQLSQTTYATLYAIFGSNRYGTDTGGNFYLPDKTGRISAMKEASSSRLTTTYFGGNSTALGATGGSESHTLTTAELAAHSHTATDSGHQHATAAGAVYGGSSTGGFTTGATTAPAGTVNLNASMSTGFASASISVANAGSGNAHAIVPPTIICNYIMRVL